MKAYLQKPTTKKNNLAYLPAASRAVPLKKRLTTLVVVGIFLYFAVLLAGQYWRMSQLQRTLDELNREIAGFKSANEAMKQEIERLHSPDYLEQLAREELGMVRPGELLFYFQDGDKLSKNKE